MNTLVVIWFVRSREVWCKAEKKGRSQSARASCGKSILETRSHMRSSIRRQDLGFSTVGFSGTMTVDSEEPAILAPRLGNECNRSIHLKWGSSLLTWVFERQSSVRWGGICYQRVLLGNLSTCCRNLWSNVEPPVLVTTWINQFAFVDHL